MADTQAEAHPLWVRLNSATKQKHTLVNGLITSRIPLALPPHSDSPDAYLHGIHAFAQLYYTFESAWKGYISGETAGNARSSDPLAVFLKQLVEARLWRTAYLRSDIKHLQATTTPALPLADPATSETFVNIISHITAAVTLQPHVFLAYGWVLYMAIFSGGRYIRAELDTAGDAYWRSKPGSKLGRTFFYFEGQDDGNDIKAAFKENFAQADELLTESQKQDVIHEAGNIFAIVENLVNYLDRRLDTPVEIRQQTTEKSETLRHRKGKPAARSPTATEEEDMPDWAKRFAPDRRVQKSMEANHPGTYITEDIPLIPGFFVVLAGLALWYLLWSFGPKQRLLDYYDS